MTEETTTKSGGIPTAGYSRGGDDPCEGGHSCGNGASEAELLEIAQFSRRPLGAEEVYLFPLKLCDNEIDRDLERFTPEALAALGKLFVGKTGIFDHDTKGSNQTARIFSTQVVEEPGRMTGAGEPYRALRAMAYMVRGEGNRDLILEIDGGIKKEVSVSCRMGQAVCSICGADRRKSPCGHRPGERYGVQENLCHTVLTEPLDAYEWSFVAVPAQPEAGVTKGRKTEGAPLDLAAVKKALATEGELFLKGEGLRHFREELEELERLAVGGRLYREKLCRENAGLFCTLCPELSPQMVGEMLRVLTIPELEGCTKALLKGSVGVEGPQLGYREEGSVLNGGNRMFQI